MVRERFDSIIIIGTGRLAAECAGICMGDYKVSVLEYGAMRISSLQRWCARNSISYSRVDKNEIYDFLMGIVKKTLIVSANNTYILPKDILDKENLSAINYHPALLPRHPGRNAEAWTIFEQDDVAGVTWHFVDDKIDHGGIISQAEIELTDESTSLGLMRRQFDEGSKLFANIINKIRRDGFETIEVTENTTRSSDIRYSYDIPNKGCLDITWSSRKMSAFLRAMDYGRLGVLGKPCCIFDNETYMWSNYKIEQNKKGIPAIPEEGLFADDEYVIDLRGGVA